MNNDRYMPSMRDNRKEVKEDRDEASEDYRIRVSGVGNSQTYNHLPATAFLGLSSQQVPQTSVAQRDRKESPGGTKSIITSRNRTHNNIISMGNIDCVQEVGRKESNLGQSRGGSKLLLNDFEGDRKDDRQQIGKRRECR